MDALDRHIVAHNKVTQQIETDMATGDLQTILQKDPESRDKEEKRLFWAFLEILETHIEHGETLHVSLEFRRRLRQEAVEDLPIMPIMPIMPN